MAVKKQDDPLKLQYRDIVKINQNLKNICDVYYISYDDIVYMHSLIPFIEKVAVINKPIDISLYRGIMYLPNQLFDFTKDAKISKLTAADMRKEIVLGQIEDDLCVKLNKVYIPNPDVSEKYIIDESIVPQMYSKMPVIFSSIKDYKFIDLPEDKTLDILDNRMVSLLDEESGIYLTLSRNLFPTIKKGNTIQYSILPLRDETLKEKTYVLYKKITPEMTIYTICAYLNI